MDIRRIYDASLIRQVVTIDEIYPYISDDGSPCAEYYQPPIHDSLYWLAIYNADEIAAMFMFHPHNAVTYEIHTNILPKYRGKLSRDCASMAIDWMFCNTQCQKVMTWIPSNNMGASRLAKDVGLQVEGRNRRSFLKHGHLLDQILMGVTKEEFIPCH